ncbi:MAG: carboxypeptidase regulatory-like domain-containing protein [Kofleriaceae bacterium]|nr:carboxypeptidase regulatory-like domain-containing protein [Kofleriaceae bacterium]
MKKQLPLIVVALAIVLGIVLVLRPGKSSESERKSANSTLAERSGDGPATVQPASKAQEKSASVSGHVVDTRGQPVEGASVSLLPVSGNSVSLNAYESVTRTADKGAWTLKAMPSGSYSVSASAPGYLPMHLSLELAPGEQRDSLRFELRAGGMALSGQVSDALGGTLAGAVVHALPLTGAGRQESPQSVGTQADGDGKYQINLPSGSYLVWAFQEGYVSISHQVLIGTQAQKRDFSLPPGAVVEGQVLLSSDGETVPHATIRYATRRAQRFSYWGNTKGAGRVIADENGHFRIAGLHSGTLQIEARGAGSATDEPILVDLGIGEERTELKVYLKGAFEVRGRVLDRESKAPVAGVQVSIGEGIAAAGLTDESGGFVLSGVPAGSYRLTAKGGDYLPQMFGKTLLVEADVSDATIEVSRGVYLKGRVEPPMRADISIELGTMDGFGQNLLVRTQSEDDGVFSLGPMSPAKFSVMAESQSGLIGRKEVTLPADGLSGIVIALEASGSVSGTVVDGNGEVQDGLLVSMELKRGSHTMSVMVNGQNMMAKSSRTSPDGKFLIVGLEEGEYDLVVLDPQGQQMNWAAGVAGTAMDISIKKQETKSGVRLAVETRDASIVGVVLGPDGTSAADVWVRVSALSAMEMMMREGPPGHPEPGAGDGSGGESQTRSEVRMVIEDDGGDAGSEGAPGLDFGASREVPPVLTGESGKFAITGLKKGDYNLVAEGMRGTARAFMQVKTDEPVEVALASLTSIEGKVVQEGSPVRNFVVHLEGPMRKRKQVRSDEGRFLLRRVDPGTYKIRVTAEGGEAKGEIVVRASEVAKIELTMGSLVQVEGVVVDEAGDAIVGAIAVAAPMTSGGGMMLEVDDDAQSTGPTGRFKLGVSPGKYSLVILGESGPLLMHPFEVKAGQSMVNLGELKASPGGGLGGPEPEE